MHPAGSRFLQRSEERLRQTARSQGAVMIVFGIVVAMRIVSFIAFTLVVGIPGLATDPIVFRTVILIDSGLGFVLDVAIVFVALIAFSTARRVEIESDRLQLFMDNVYRKLP